MERDAQTAAEQKLKDELEEQYHTIMSLKQKLSDFEDDHIRDKENLDKLDRLYQMGIIDIHGDPVAKDD